MSTDLNKNENLYLIDAHALIYQVFHALPRMSSPDGLPTNAVFGFAKDILYLRRNASRPIWSSFSTCRAKFSGRRLPPIIKACALPCPMICNCRSR